MKLVFGVFLLGVFIIDPSQVRKDLQTIKTPGQAQAYLKKPGLTGDILELDEIADSSAVAMKLFKAKPDEVIEQTSADKKTTYFYKRLTVKESEVDRVQYVYFDISKLTKKRIDSLRGVVMKKAKAGESFAALAKQYSMDPNARRGGDTGWYDREMFVAGFVNAVKSHKKDDVFVLDLPAEKWYYVVKKSHSSIKRKQITAIYVAVPSK